LQLWPETCSRSSTTFSDTTTTPWSIGYIFSYDLILPRIILSKALWVELVPPGRYILRPLGGMIDHGLISIKNVLLQFGGHWKYVNITFNTVEYSSVPSSVHA
jgi:hypothetical protein